MTVRKTVGTCVRYCRGFNLTLADADAEHPQKARPVRAAAGKVKKST